MKNVLCVLTVISALISCSRSEFILADFDALVNSELAFADSALELGINKAFLQNLHEDAIMFRPGPIRAHEFYSKNQISGILTWRPVSADIAPSGDLGYTTGPWEYRPGSIVDPPIAFGCYVSIWQKQQSGFWKILLDVGNEFEAPDSLTANLIGKIRSRKQSVERRESRKHAQDELLLRDAEFSRMLKSVGSKLTYSSFAHEKIRMYRKHYWPVVGKPAVDLFLKDTMKLAESRVTAVRTSIDGDLGFAFGVDLFKNTNNKSLHEFAFLRIWKREAELGWQLVLDLTNPIPADQD